MYYGETSIITVDGIISDVLTRWCRVLALLIPMKDYNLYLNPELVRNITSLNWHSGHSDYPSFYTLLYAGSMAFVYLSVFVGRQWAISRRVGQQYKIWGGSPAWGGRRTMHLVGRQWAVSGCVGSHTVASPGIGWTWYAPSGRRGTVWGLFWRQ